MSIFSFHPFPWDTSHDLVLRHVELLSIISEQTSISPDFTRMHSSFELSSCHIQRFPINNASLHCALWYISAISINPYLPIIYQDFIICFTELSSSPSKVTAFELRSYFSYMDSSFEMHPANIKRLTISFVACLNSMRWNKPTMCFNPLCATETKDFVILDIALSATPAQQTPFKLRSDFPNMNPSSIGSSCYI